MNEDLPDIEELFKSALDDNEEFPSKRVWDGIENTLNKEDIVSIKRKYDNVKKLTFLLLFLLIGLIINELNFPRPKTNFTNVNPTMKSSEFNYDYKFKTKRTSTSHFNSNTLAEANNDNSSGNRNTFSKSQTENLSGNCPDENQNENLKNTYERNKRYIAISNADVIESPNYLFAKSSSLSLIEFQEKASTNIRPAFDLSNLFSKNKKTFLSENDKQSPEARVKKDNSKKSRFSVTAFLSPDFASYRLQDNGHDNGGSKAAEIEKNESHELSSTIGALVEYRFKKNLSIESGLTFSNTNISVEPHIIYAQAANSGDIKYRLNTSSGYGYVLPSFSRTPSVGDSLYALTSTHTLQYLSLPAQLKVNARFRNFEFDVMAGAVVNFLIRGRIETSVENGSANEPEVVGKLYGLKKIYFSGLTGVGVSYHINDKIAISLSPTFRYALNSINKNTPVKSYPNSLMFPIGLKIKL